MFDAHGLPEVCVAARRGQGPEGSGSLRSGGPSAGMWEVEHFENDRLPTMKEALMLTKLGEDPQLWNWEARIWSELSLEDYRALAQELILSENRSRAAEARVAAYRAGSPDSAKNSSRSWLS